MPIKAHNNRPAIINRKTGADPATRIVTSSQRSTSLGLALILYPETSSVVVTITASTFASFPLATRCVSAAPSTSHRKIGLKYFIVVDQTTAVGCWIRYCAIAQGSGSLTRRVVKVGELRLQTLEWIAAQLTC